MLELLSKIKEKCHNCGIDLINSQIIGDEIKLACTVNGRRDTELNAYIIPDGDSFEFYTIGSTGDRSETVKLTEEQILPTLVEKVSPKMEVEIEPETDGEEVIEIEVEPGVIDTKVAKSGIYTNSRYAYSNKYNKMGVIISIKPKNNK